MAQNPDQFDCARCKWGKHCNKDNPAPTDIFRLKHGDYEVKQNTCFLPEFDQAASMMLKLHAHYRDGHLLCAGGIADQPAPYIASMRWITWLLAQGT